ncbi:MAG: hypothetical protein A2091_08680 [Desulfuromonadales bacterium GWD2_61_12]|nr:MAG: hypothetical protein A2091_08680 [Desulfuromonadales bacterium GWD2_61_12]
MTDNTLLERLARLGLPLMEAGGEVDVNQTLADVVKSRDTRLWEGFPVLLVNAARDYRFEYDRVLTSLVTDGEKEDFRALLLLSLALYDNLRLSFYWTKQLKAQLSDRDTAQLKQLTRSLSHDAPFTLAGREFQAGRLKGMFELYFEKGAEKGRQRKDTYDELALEYALSQLFSPKQKELFRKKLDGLPLTKTEKEYYSRAVKKKVAALANAELHRQARMLMEL